LDPARFCPRLCRVWFLRETPLPLLPVDGHNVAVSARGKVNPRRGHPGARAPQKTRGVVRSDGESKAAHIRKPALSQALRCAT